MINLIFLVIICIFVVLELIVFIYNVKHRKEDNKLKELTYMSNYLLAKSLDRYVECVKGEQNE